MMKNKAYLPVPPVPRYLHLGRNESVDVRSVVGIFDLETASLRAETRNYLKQLQNEKRVVNLCGDELPKSFVVADDENAETAYLTAISANSLQNRLREHK